MYLSLRPAAAVFGGHCLAQKSNAYPILRTLYSFIINLERIAACCFLYFNIGAIRKQSPGCAAHVFQHVGNLTSFTFISAVCFAYSYGHSEELTKLIPESFHVTATDCLRYYF